MIPVSVIENFSLQNFNFVVKTLYEFRQILNRNAALWEISLSRISFIWALLLRTFGERFSIIWSTFLPEEIPDRITLPLFPKISVSTSFKLNISGARIAWAYFLCLFFFVQDLSKSNVWTKCSMVFWKNSRWFNHDIQCKLCDELRVNLVCFIVRKSLHI